MPSSAVVPLKNDENIDVKRLNSRTRVVSTQTLDSTQRLVQLIDETKETAIKTMVALDNQGEKLDLIEEGNTEVREDIKQAERHFSDMEKCCGLFTMPKIPWRKNKNLSKADEMWKWGVEKIVLEQPVQVLTVEMTPRGGFITRITNDSMEYEMEENMAHVHTTIENLKHMAVDINSEVIAQNRQIDNINLKTKSNVDQVKDADTRINKLVK